MVARCIYNQLLRRKSAKWAYKLPILYGRVKILINGVDIEMEMNVSRFQDLVIELTFCYMHRDVAADTNIPGASLN